MAATYTLHVIRKGNTEFATAIVACSQQDALKQAEALALLLEADHFTLTDHRGREVVS
mgnify:CR=1 FL=1